MYSVYVLFDPRDENTLYVGMAQDPRKRYLQHLAWMEEKRSIKDQWLCELWEQGEAPLMRVIETMNTKRQASKREQYWIKRYLSQEGIIVKNTRFTPRDKERRRELSGYVPPSPVEKPVVQQEFFDLSQVWSLFRIDEETSTDLIQQKRLTAYKFGKRLKVRRSDLEKFIENSKTDKE